MEDEENSSNAIPLPSDSLSEWRASLITEIREAWRAEEQELKAHEQEDAEQAHADEQGFEHHLVKVELGTVFIAVIAIFIMHRMELDGLAEVGTLIPSSLLALFRIFRT